MAADVTAGVDKSAVVQQYIMHHVTDSHEWVLPFLKVRLPDFLSLHALMVLLAAAFLLVLFGLAYRRKDPVPRGITNLLEVLVLFIRNNICIPNLGEKDGRRMAPLFCSFFFFILTLNLMGLIPLFATATGNVNVTAALALITLGFMIFGTIYKNGVGGFIHAFIPHGVPWPVLILLVPIEFLGMFIKAFALTIRLFANMLAGHLMLKVFAGFSTMLAAIGFGGVLAGFIPMVFNVALYALELLVALMQAYIFAILSSIYLKDTLDLHH